MFVCACAYVANRELIDIDIEIESKRERECVCVCLCVRRHDTAVSTRTLIIRFVLYDMPSSRRLGGVGSSCCTVLYFYSSPSRS